ncbi:thiamine phosphate synthase [Jidongwangia harbinensis]|uniref:thiamine phosphate synthase n=1 Tax=Jidongwangia harbinensis TaxID=2878561 RepID=UPI001CD97DBC|nr:thiamine phosphate synthase [Jidongwangia harbinensis]MCA2212941.1 thiamine phosphate synthase [Jidongwangia harbinensis]
MDPSFPRLHLVTGPRPMETVRAAVDVAARLGMAAELAVQVRVEDHVTDRVAYDLTLAVLAVTRPHGVLCLVNDRLHVAVAAGADGGHVGADDLPVAAARAVLGPAAVLGATARTPDGGTAARASGATYLGVGPAYATSTKDGLPEPIGPAGVAAVTGAVLGLPVLAIGGVTAGRVPDLRAAGAHGVAVVGAIAADPERATEDLLKALA